MTSSTPDVAASRRRPASSFPQRHPWDSNAVLAAIDLVWLGVLLGFVPEMVRHVVRREPAYPWIVHVHGAVFVGWLALLTVQAAAIRGGRTALHRRLGAAGAGLAALMLMVGPATAIIMDRREFGTPDDNTPFLFVQMTDMISFAVLAGAGLALRGAPAAHRRLMLLATFYISDAGFSRWLGEGVHATWGDGRAAYFAGLYLGSDLLVLGMGVYDLVTRRRLHRAYLAAIAWILAVQALSVYVRWLPAWRVVATRLLGH